MNNNKKIGYKKKQLKECEERAECLKNEINGLEKGAKNNEENR